MPTGAATVEVRATPEQVFDLLHDYGRRLDWDPFLRRAELRGDAERAAVGVRTWCVARRCSGGLGLGMETVYVSFERPSVAAVRMTRGPRLLRSFAASLRQTPVDGDRTRVAYKFHFEVSPRWAARLLEPLFGALFRRETRRRLACLARFMDARPHDRC